MSDRNGYEPVDAASPASAYSHLHLRGVATETEIRQLPEGLNADWMQPVTCDTVLEQLQLPGITPN
jgi:hypothetical protein